MFLSRNLRTWTALHTGVLANLAATEQSRQAHVSTWADHDGTSLAWATDWALGRITLEHGADVSPALDMMDTHTWHTGGVTATGLTVVFAHFANHLGADWAGNLNVSVNILDVDGGASWVLVVLHLWRILDTLVSLDDVLA